MLLMHNTTIRLISFVFVAEQYMTEDPRYDTQAQETLTRPFGIILTRHVRDTTTNEYWNLCVKRLCDLYHEVPIVIIDDNSNSAYLKDLYEHEKNPNILTIQSCYPGAGELLPYYYLHKHKWFHSAAIVHDSVFFQSKINFQKLTLFKVIPFWHFRYMEDREKCHKLASHLKNSQKIIDKLTDDQVSIFSVQPGERWQGCFGCQAFIRYDFLHHIQEKYNLFALLNVVTTRNHRMCLERVLGTIFVTEAPNLHRVPSLLGDIWKYQTWNTSYNTYMQNRKRFKHMPVVKVWSGR